MTEPTDKCPCCGEDLEPGDTDDADCCDGPECGSWLNGFDHGRLAAIRAEVAYALRAMDADAASRAQNVAAWARVLVSGQALTYEHAFIVGARHVAERRRRHAVGFLAATRRWLQETA